jgi:hypothetical protein
VEKLSSLLILFCIQLLKEYTEREKELIKDMVMLGMQVADIKDYVGDIIEMRSNAKRLRD